MRIGQLAQRTGTSPRLLRYYEEQGLLVAERSGNGYRDYDERYVERVRQIRGLLESGLPTRVIKQILPCISQPGAIYVSDATPETIATLEQERDRMTERIQFLVRNRNAIAAYLDAVRSTRSEDIGSDSVGAAAE
ncbi:MerR family transcriptional regulator [Actinacidiphila acididurans]|uniref:MerR family transcriptional regulator n=1 Tax=Actinacidiphila acididurans TaxID=2784346 RepID=A0ABS2TVB6_9ACTN|nr:MerR family transcriptional regulator [Actinacidiphila acididurans]MBM9507280.1 MerR family transcriptional regulator [Actinacidiphila acididurans]